MLHREFWGVLFLAFVGWIFIAADPQARIARTCRPVLWTGNVGVSLTAFASSTGAESVQRWTNKLDYGCRYSLWRLIYQDDYLRYLQAVPAGQTSAPGQTPSTAAVTTQSGTSP